MEFLRSLKISPRWFLINTVLCFAAAAMMGIVEHSRESQFSGDRITLLSLPVMLPYVQIVIAAGDNPEGKAGKLFFGGFYTFAFAALGYVFGTEFC